MVDVVFLTTFIGAGHKRVAQVVAEQLTQKNLRCLIINIFEKLTPSLNITLKHLYIASIKYTPWVWKNVYYNNKTNFNQSSLIIDVILKILAWRLEKLLLQLQPKIIVCTQAIPCKLLSFFDINCLKIAILTDFATHNYWFNEKINAFICNINNAPCLIEGGIPKEKIYEFGIPTCIDSDRALPKTTEKTVVMVMGGGEGIGLDIVIPLILNFEKTNKNFHFIVLYGRNKSVYKSLKNAENCQLIPYTTDIKKLYAMSDILVTKPGGVTLQEAMNRGIKLILLPPCAENERINVEFLTRHRAAILAQNPQQLEMILSKHHEMFININSKNFAAPFATKNTVQLILSLYKNIAS